MSKTTLTAKQLLLQRELEVKGLELQARFWKANFELKDFYLKDKAIESEYKEAYAKDLEEFSKMQENSIRALSQEESVIVNAEPNNN